MPPATCRAWKACQPEDLRHQAQPIPGIRSLAIPHLHTDFQQSASHVFRAGGVAVRRLHGTCSQWTPHTRRAHCAAKRGQEPPGTKPPPTLRPSKAKPGQNAAPTHARSIPSVRTKRTGKPHARLRTPREKKGQHSRKARAGFLILFFKKVSKIFLIPILIRTLPPIFNR